VLEAIAKDAYIAVQNQSHRQRTRICAACDGYCSSTFCLAATQGLLRVTQYRPPTSTSSLFARCPSFFAVAAVCFLFLVPSLLPPLLCSSLSHRLSFVEHRICYPDSFSHRSDIARAGSKLSSDSVQVVETNAIVKLVRWKEIPNIYDKEHLSRCCSSWRYQTLAVTPSVRRCASCASFDSISKINNLSAAQNYCQKHNR
jgi:hypothetical protein